MKTLLIAMMFALTIITQHYKTESLTKQLTEVTKALQEKQQVITWQHQEVLSLRQYLQELHKYLFENTTTLLITGYAPLCQEAVLGMDFEGDPNVTASGSPPIPLKTAASNTLPFGTRVWIESIGVVTINDRGGNLAPNQIDVVFQTREQALLWGRRMKRTVILPVKEGRKARETN